MHCINQPININEAMKYFHGQHDVISSTLNGNVLMYKRQMTSHYLPDKTHPKHLDNSQTESQTYSLEIVVKIMMIRVQVTT